MPKPVKGARLGSGPAHHRMILNGLAADLIREERIRTTESKAKLLRPVAEKLITLGKAGTVHARRQALSQIEDREIIHKLFADVAPRFSERNGGYTRILKLGPRQGDAAAMAIVELVEGASTVTGSEESAEQKRRRRLRRRKASPAKGSPEATAATQAPVDATPPETPEPEVVSTPKASAAVESPAPDSSPEAAPPSEE